MDAYGDSEQIVGWFTVIEENREVPFETVVLGAPATVERIDLTCSEHIVAVRRRGRSRQSLSILDLPLATPPPKGAEWIEVGRGLQSDVPDAHGGRRGKNSTSEVYIRNMLQAWLGYMTNGHSEMRAAS